MSDVTERFVALVQGPPERIVLDEAALLVAAHAHPSLDIPARTAQLDRLASDVRVADPDGVAQALFVGAGFAGNTGDYYDPSNSYLDDVLDRRLGIPITLAVVMIEVGRRVGVELVGVGMPGHFLVGVPRTTPADHEPWAADPGPEASTGPGPVDTWYDPFHGAEALGVAECAALFSRVHGATPYGHPLRLEQLAPVGPFAILDRLLANLQQTLLHRAPAQAAWPARLRLRFPAVPAGRRAELATTLGNLGQFGEAAAVLDALAAELPPEPAARTARAAAELRARAN